MVLLQIGNGVPPPGSCSTAGIVKKEERMEVWINRARKKEGRKEREKKDTSMYIMGYIS